MASYHKRKKIFQTLIKACEEDDAYSVSMMCAKANISYAQIKAWAQEDEIWSQSLEMCKSICEGNIEVALLMKRIEFEEALPFLIRSE